MAAADVEVRMRLLSPGLDLGVLSDCDLVIEDMVIKQDVFRKLDRIAKKDAILASNTSYLNIDEIAGVTGRRETVLGMPSCAASTIVTGIPALRKFIEMPPPMVPAPITPTFLIGNTGVSSGRSAIFQTLRSAKKT